jgi:hypothetical protein
MLPDDARLAKLTQTLKAKRRLYIALGMADEFKSANTGERSTFIGLARIAAAKTDWEFAKKALVDYQAGNF